MGPQLDSCGKGRYIQDVSAIQDASMGPQLDSCGKNSEDVERELKTLASMGPQLDSCGKFRLAISSLSDLCFNGAAT